jgi:hypothetical protein
MSKRFRCIGWGALVVSLTALSGCMWFQGPGGGIIAEVATSGNLLENPNADEGGLHWNDPNSVFSVQASSGNPAFATQGGGALFQIVDIRNQLGSHAVLVGMTATENLRPYTGIGLVHGYFRDRDDETLIAGYLLADTSSSQATQSNEWSIVYGIFPIPSTAGSIIVFLEALVDPADPPDGTYTWFDNLGLYIAGSLDAAQQVVSEYIADNPWAVTSVSAGE